MEVTVFLKKVVLSFATAAVAGVFAGCNVTPHSHMFDEWEMQKPPSCTEDGKEIRTCGCGKTETRSIPKLGHSSEEWLYSDGTHYKICDVCGNAFDEGVHSIFDGVCTVCNYKETSPATLNYELTADGNGYIVTGGDGEAVIIPEAYQGLPVLEVADYAFEDAHISSLEIPSTVTRIGKRAFAYCLNLQEIELPSSLISFGDFAFWASGVKSAVIDCDTGKGMFRECTSLKTVEFGENVTSIGEQAFYKCSALVEAEIPSGATCGAYAFSGSGLKKITVSGDPLGSAVLDTKYLFKDCPNLVEARFTATAVKTAYYAFDTCSSLERYVLDEDYPHYKSVNGIIYSNDLKTCVKAGHGIKGTVEIIDGVTALSGEQPFRGCALLTSVNLPSTLKEIANASFYGSGITSLNIPDGITTLGAAMFSGCENLESVHIGSGVTSIGNKAFSDCPNLKIVTVSAENTVYKSVDNCIVKGYGTANCYLIYSDGNNVIPQCVTRLGEYVFSGRDMTSITIPSGITVIERGAFDGCENLETVSLPSTLLSISSYAFKNCRSLQRLTVPRSVTSISSWAFQGCTSLNSIVFEKTAGWTVKKNSSTEAAVSVDVTDAAQNAVYLKDTYNNYNWRSSAA